MAFIEMDFASGGIDNNEHYVYGVSQQLTTNFQEVDCGFVPDVVIFYYFGGSTATWNVVADFNNSKILNIYKNGSNTGATSTKTDEKIEILNDGTKKGFKIKASNTANLLYGKTVNYYAMKKEE